MTHDVINGFEWSFYGEDELAAARQAQDAGNPRVLIATTCDECGGPIQASVEQVDNRADEPIVHVASYHE